MKRVIIIITMVSISQSVLSQSSGLSVRAPCREESPHVVGACEKHKDKNFTVLSVSLDNPGKKEDWLAAIEKDGLPWTHVSDLWGWDNLVAVQYNVRGIPANFLIDPDGKIIAKDLRGDDLERTLAEILENEY